MNPLLPLFPLQLVVFPGEKLKLHIFEPRYKQLITECHEQGITFGIPAVHEGRLAEYGTQMRLVHIFATYPDGEMDVLTDGLQVFHIEEFVMQVPERLYAGGRVTFLENEPRSFPITVEELARQYARFHELLKTGYKRERFDVENVSFQIAQEIGLSMAQKVELLSLRKESDRQLMLINHLHNVIPKLEAATRMQKRVRGNGHIKLGK